jgi:GR25 family glycosyltransferase involved in LPS biosynthesis
MYDVVISVIFLTCIFGIIIFLINIKIDNHNLRFKVTNLTTYVKKYHKENNVTIQKKTKEILGDIPILFIVLKRNKERVQNIQQIIKKYQLTNYHIIDAIDYKNFSISKEKVIKILDFKKFIIHYGERKVAEIACFLSHIKAMYFAYSNNFEKVLIIEDDVNFDLLFTCEKKLNDYLRIAPNDCEMLSLYNGLPDSKTDKMFIPYSFGTIGYIIYKNSIEKYFKKLSSSFFQDETIHLEKFCIENTCTSDNILSEILHGYSLSESKLIPNNLHIESTIHNDHTESNHLPLQYDVLYNFYASKEKKPIQKIISILEQKNIKIYEK